jgi:hypothetical protein
MGMDEFAGQAQPAGWRTEGAVGAAAVGLGYELQG